MWRVTNENYKYIENVLQNEKEKNIYILGDIAQYGLDCEQIECFADGTLENPEYVLLRFGNSYVVYMPNLDISLEELRRYWEKKEIHCISGETKTIKRIAQILPHDHMVVNKMLKISGTNIRGGDLEEEKIILLSKECLPIIQKFYCEIEEFCEKMKGEAGKHKLEEQFNNGKMYGLCREQKLLAVAALSAETESFAMVDNVATANEVRKQGLGYSLMKQICYQELSENRKDFLCVCCSDKKAENLYKKVGFQEIGTYSMLYID